MNELGVKDLRTVVDISRKKPLLTFEIVERLAKMTIIQVDATSISHPVFVELCSAT